MKWIGQHIYDLISRFRNEAVFEYYSFSIGGNKYRTTTINGDELKLANSSNTSGPLIDIRNTADNNTGATVDYYNSRANPANDDKILLSRYIANNDNGDAFIVGQQLWSFADVSDGAEKGKYGLSLAAHASAGSYNFFQAEAKGSDDIDVAIARGSASTTTIRGELIVNGGTFNFDNVGITAIQTSAESFVDNDTSLMTSAAILDKITSATVGAAVDLTSEVSGTLPVANGGTGATSLTDNKLLTGTGTSAVTAEANATYDGADLSLTSATSTKPILSIENTTNDGNAGELKLIGRRSADASILAGTGDDAGTISFVGENAKSGPDPETITYGKIVGENSAATDGAEMGKMTMSVGVNQSAIGGSLGFFDFLSSTSSVVGETTTYGSGNLLSSSTFDSTVTVFQSAVSTGPQMTVRNHTDDATGGSLAFLNSRGALANDTANQNGDDLGSIKWHGFDSGVGITTFAQMLGEAESVTHTDEAGKLSLTVATSDGSTSALQNAFTATGQATHNYISTTIGYGTASVATIAGTLTMGSTAAMTNAGQLSVAAQPNITTMTGVFTGSANQLLTDDGDGTVTSESDVTYDSGAFSITSATGGRPSINLTATGTAASKSANLNFIKDAADTEDNELLGVISFQGEDEGNNNTTFANIQAAITESDETDEAGQLAIQVATSDGTTSTSRNALFATGSASADDVDVTLGHGSTSIITAPGFVSIGGHAVNDIDVAGEFVDSDEHLMTAAAIDDRINAASADEVVSAGNHILKQTKVTIDTSGFNGLNSTPVDLVAAQGANTMIVPTEVVVFADRAATNTNSTDLIVAYNGGTSFATAVKYIRRFMQNVTTDRITIMGPYVGTASNDLTTPINSKLTIALGAAPTTNCMTSLTVYTSYYVIDIS